LADGGAARHRADQPAQEDARARPVPRQPGAAPVVKRGGLGLAGALGFSAVAFGAFGAHGLRGRLSPAMLEVFRTGALYHLVHAVAALAVALAGDRLRRGRTILTLLTAGIVVFAGSLY